MSGAVEKPISSAPSNIQTIMNDFINETKNELWSSEKELIDHYRKDENYMKLLRGEDGGNLILMQRMQRTTPHAGLNLIQVGDGSWVQAGKWESEFGLRCRCRS